MQPSQFECGSTFSLSICHWSTYFFL